MTAPDTLPPELAELGELLREDPPRPDPAWARELDDRVAAGFPRPPRPSLWARLRPPRAALLPTLGFACTVLLVVGLASMNTDSDNSGSGGGSSAVSEPAAGSSEGAGGGSEAAGGAASRSQGDEDALLSRPQSAPPVSGGGNPGSDSRRTRLQERSASLTLAAPRGEIETVADGILRVTDAARGFVASSSVSGGESAGGTFELRIPVSRLPKAIADLSRLAHVRERSQASRDITAESVSARERLREARREREGLLRALARATTLNETEAIKARLRSVNAEIRSARTASRRVANRAAFANVSVQLVADDRAAAAADGKWTPGDALGDAVRVLEVAAGVLLIALAVALPFALLAVLVAAALRVNGRRRRERALDMA